jgi:hypothetical protein
VVGSSASDKPIRNAISSFVPRKAELFCNKCMVERAGGLEIKAIAQ